MLSEQQKKEWMQLAFSENVGPITFHSLLSFFGTPKEALAHVDEFARRGGRTREIKIADERQVDEQLRLAEEFDTQIIVSGEKDYPRLLKKTTDMPPVLFARGHFVLTQKNAVALVGTRNASLNGRSFARRLALDLAQKDYVVVSGMAKGIDTAAHEGALGADIGMGGTIAVVGTPLNEVYPAENDALFKQICERGCVLSELPFGSPTSPQNFPRRNRIISGLSKGVCVVEAQGKSGSLITARLAKEQERLLFAVPGFPLDARSEGPNKLIKQGATLVENATDILYELEDLTNQHRFNEPDAFDEVIMPSYPSVSDNELDKARKIITDSLSSQPTGVDELIRGTELTVQIVSIILVELELAGRIERHPGGRVSLLFD
ncbi:MAG: DNA-processing protein DprA [Alphaproteobacteria bacterium]|nr:DNA-processing protein DprA [Alphaproteobacteria bacterium]